MNDPNGWFEDPRDCVAPIERIVYVSVESTRIIVAVLPLFFGICSFSRQSQILLVP